MVLCDKNKQKPSKTLSEVELPRWGSDGLNSLDEVETSQDVQKKQEVNQTARKKQKQAA